MTSPFEVILFTLVQKCHFKLLLLLPDPENSTFWAVAPVPCHSHFRDVVQIKPWYLPYQMTYSMILFKLSQNFQLIEQLWVATAAAKEETRVARWNFQKIPKYSEKIPNIFKGSREYELHAGKSIFFSWQTFKIHFGKLVCKIPNWSHCMGETGIGSSTIRLSYFCWQAAPRNDSCL